MGRPSIWAPDLRALRRQNATGFGAAGQNARGGARYRGCARGSCRKTLAAVGWELVHADARGPANDTLGATGRRRLYTHAKQGTRTGGALPGRALHNLRLFPGMQFVEYDVGHRPGAASSATRVPP